MILDEINNVYCLGIGGIGVSGLARIFSSMGKKVWGSDIRGSEVTKSLESTGIKVIIGHSIENLNPKPDLVIYSLDVSPDSAGLVEMEEIDKQKIPKMSQAQVLGLLMADKYGIGVTGTNGKSTTTAMLGLILEHANFDPTVLVGSMLSPKNESDKFRANARLGAGKYFVAESDEYHRKMLENHPRMIVLTNVAEDHLDYYRDIDEIRKAFLEYVHSLPSDGLVIYNADDHNTVEVGRHAPAHKYTFGIHHYADLQAINLKIESGKRTFDVHLNDQMIGQIELSVPGIFNVSNALGAALAALKLGVNFGIIQESLKNYRGIWRRFEKVGEFKGRPVISDYAHHPDAISGTIQAAKEFYPGKKILVVFQPHHRNRTKKLFGALVESLLSADEVIISEIFDVSGREHGEDISSKNLVEELKKSKEAATFAENLDQAQDLINAKIESFDVILMMGAGDIDSLARKIVRN